MRVLGLTLLTLSLSSFAFAGTLAPEIDASSGMAALGLLSGGLMILRARKKK